MQIGEKVTGKYDEVSEFLTGLNCLSATSRFGVVVRVWAIVFLSLFVCNELIVGCES